MPRTTRRCAVIIRQYRNTKERNAASISPSTDSRLFLDRAAAVPQHGALARVGHRDTKQQLASTIAPRFPPHRSCVCPRSVSERMVTVRAHQLTRMLATVRADGEQRGAQASLQRHLHGVGCRCTGGLSTRGCQHVPVCGPACERTSARALGDKEGRKTRSRKWEMRICIQSNPDGVIMQLGIMDDFWLGDRPRGMVCPRGRTHGQEMPTATKINQAPSTPANRGSWVINSRSLRTAPIRPPLSA